MSATRTPQPTETGTIQQKRTRSGKKAEAKTDSPSSARTTTPTESPAAPDTQAVKRAKATSTMSAAGKRRDVVTATLRQRLATLYAQTLLATPDGQLPAPTEDAIAALLNMAVGTPLSLAKRSMLLNSLVGFDAQAEALRLTPSQIAAFLPTTPADPQDEQAGELTVTQLDALLPGAWQDAARWLLEQEGYTVERLGAVNEMTTRWRCEPTRKEAGDGRRDAQAMIASVVRLPAGWPLDAATIERAMTAATEDGASDKSGEKTGALLLTTAEATVGAIIAARRLSVQLLDRSALCERLNRYSTAYQREQAQANEETTARSDAAIQAHTRLLAALDTQQQPLALLATDGQNATRTSKISSGRAMVKKAAALVSEARRMTQQALLAWETLLGEWNAAFGERPARDGSLLFAVAPGVYDELGERGAHLGEALAAALNRLAATAADGEFGYGAWRQAVAEEVIARCEALRWRVLALNPTHWQDFAVAHDDAAAQEASRATNIAIHAATRAEKAASQLTERGII